MDSIERQQAQSNPGGWWRRLGWATEQVGLCGDLAYGSEGIAQLEGWVDEGVTHILDLRIEANDEQLVSTVAPQLTYFWHGADDAGGKQGDEWFASGVAAGLVALADPKAKLVVHCHMGVNRGPSMAYALLLAQGMGPVEAMVAIREARPIAAAIYAEEALEWHLREQGADQVARRRALMELGAYLDANPVDTSWVISRIRQVGG